MKKQVFLYFLVIGLIIEAGFYLSDGLAREKEKHGFQECRSSSHIKNRPEWRQECKDLTIIETAKKLVNSLKM